MIEERDVARCTAADQTRALLRKECPAEAIRLLRAILMERVGTAEEYILLATALGQTGETTAALQALEEAVAVDPGDAAAHFNLGNHYLQVGRRHEALQEFEYALFLRPQYAAAAAAAAQLRQQLTPSPLPGYWQPPRVTPLAATPRAQRLIAPPPATDGSSRVWNSVITTPVPVIESPSMAPPRSLSILLILTYAGATFGLISGLFVLLTGGLISPTGLPAPGADDASATAIMLGTAVLVIALSAARLVIGNYLWHGYPWARPAMMGVLAMGMFPPFLTLCQASGLYEALQGISGLMFSLVFLCVLNLRGVKEYCAP